MINMHNVKYYVIATLDIIFLQIIHDWTWIDESLKRASLFLGIVVGIITAIKGVQDFLKNRQDRKLKQMDIKIKEEEVRRFFETKYSRK
jgi:hypothetical protein